MGWMASLSMSGNEFYNVRAGLAIHERTAGMPLSVTLSGNRIIDSDVGILYKTD